MNSHKTIPLAVRQHVEESAALRNIRSSLVTAPHVKLHHLRRLDDRLAAHLDGLAVAGADGWNMSLASLQRPGRAEIFVVAVTAITERRSDGLEQVLAVSEAIGDTGGLVSAFGWLESINLQGSVKALLQSRHSFHRIIGIGACAVHGTDFRITGGPTVDDPNPTISGRALRAVGELGLIDLAEDILGAMSSADDERAFWSAWTLALLGDRHRSVEALTRAGNSPGAQRRRAFRLAIQSMTLNKAHQFLQSLTTDSENLRRLIQGSGIAGDPTYVPWLINHMGDDNAARAAGEAFSLITGADLALIDLERKPPENFESGPNDDPDDPNVAMDDDDGLPWPDATKIERWWREKSSEFQKGTRYFMGQPVTREHCINVLKDGYQRQRILAAHYLCLLEPGTPLFNTSAPAWRQERLLAAI
jgi:uncharacterized protein (TIGR02270 family)